MGDASHFTEGSVSDTPHAPRLRWSMGNRKINKTGALLSTSAVSFNLPAFKSEDGFRVCPGSGTCSKVCYARQGWFNRSVVAGLREDNLAVLRAAADPAQLLQALVDELAPDVGLIRLHDSGDFYSRAYLDAWLTVIRSAPSKLFYAYTKSIPIVLPAVAAGDIPDNLKLVYSEGGRWDHLIPEDAPHSRIFANHARREAAGWIDGNGDEADLPAIRGDKRIGLVYHGGSRDTGVLDQTELFSET